MREKILIIFPALFFLSCSSIDSSRIAPGYSEAFKAIKYAIIGYEDQFITKEIVDNIPYASALMKIGKGPSGLIILERIDGSSLTWISADRVYVITKNGRITRTSGLNNNLVDLTGASRNKSFLSQEDGQIYYNYFSYDVPYLRDLKVESRIVKRAEETVQLLSGERKLICIEEEIKNDYIGWKKLNKFWIDESGFVWKSEQYISPKLPKIILEVTKKPS